MKINHTEYRSFLLGNILGDGSLKFGTFAVKQISEDLIDFKKSIFDRCCNSNVSKTVIPERIGHKENYQIYVSSNKYLLKICHRYCTPNRNNSAFYANPTIDMLNRLTPLGIAIWFADDGTTVLVGKNSGIVKYSRVQFCTDRYTREQVEIISQYFSDRYGKTSIVKRGNRYRVQLSIDSAVNMFQEIYMYFYNYFPSLLYKIDLGQRDNFIIPEYEKIYNTIKTHPQFINRLSDDIV